MPEIVSAMTVKEAAALLPTPDQILLKRWGETFGIRLSEFHIGHVKTYQIDRATEVEAAVVDCEVEALIDLLRKLGLAQEIERYYKPLVDPAELTTEELNALRRASANISKLWKKKSPNYAQAKRVLRTSSRICGGRTTGAEQDIKNRRRSSLLSGPSITYASFQGESLTP